MTRHERTIYWRDPAPGLAALPELSGLEFMTRVARGELPGAPIAGHFAMDMIAVGPGKGACTFDPPDRAGWPIVAPNTG